MAAKKRPTDVHLYKRFRADNTDHAAFETLYRRYYPPCGNLLDWDGQNLVDWVQYEQRINGFDADDIVADCWADLTINQPDIRRCFRAFVYQKLNWLIGDYWDRRREPEKPWEAPWRALSNSSFFDPDEKPTKETVQTEIAAALRDERIRSRQLTYFLDHAILQEAITRLSAQERQTIQLHWIEGRTIEEAAKAAGTTFARFRTRNERALKRLCNEFFRIKYKTETLEDQTKLLSQWGDIRPDHHWVPDDENQECNCSACEKIRRDITSLHGGTAVPPKPDPLPDLMAIIVTDHDGYKLPAHKLRGTSFAVPIICRRKAAELSALIASRT
jgi:RNA polymerase sigma factor (sigma-70 family)